MWDKRIQAKARQGNQAKKPKAKSKAKILEYLQGQLKIIFH